jgi:DNA-binding transcriptional LysR family regulator
MLIDQLNLNQLRIFECVYRTRNMTTASKELHLTQSGISQHVKALEDMLEVRLFDRIRRGLVPTTEGSLLYRQASESLQAIERALSEIKGGSKELHGVVSVGMPIEFGNNVILPLVAEFARKHPFVTFQFKLDFASAMEAGLLRGELDFAFVDDFRLDRRIESERVFDEVLELCISRELLSASRSSAKAGTREYFESLRYVEYQENQPMLKMWFAHHLGWKGPKLTSAATLMDVQGVARLIRHGLGAGILPSYLLAQLKRDGAELITFPGCGKPLKNQISLAWLAGRSQTTAASQVMQALRTGLAKLQKRARPGPG